ncbi:hypothetical protein [Nitrosococcus wardiae]|uniref:Uncharacterized protein n=1 Tax=Nitrosococcus wardiae TaxID=1814290 RepID=A0A4P7C107_9GAMM|nr:hypothetical protein [Nitrosococcus wardiae]QBQ54446.1 hypothetical protein E3U44_07950 [Nitrosococcus wardiae]
MPEEVELPVLLPRFVVMFEVVLLKPITREQSNNLKAAVYVFESGAAQSDEAVSALGARQFDGLSAGQTLGFIDFTAFNHAIAGLFTLACDKERCPWY